MIVPYIEFTHTVKDLVDDQWLIDPNKLQPNMIVNGCSEHYGDGMLELLASKVPDSTVFSHNPEDHELLPNLKFYPFWYHWSRWQFEELYRENIANDRKRYTLSCLNLNTHNSRILNYVWLEPSDDMWFVIRQRGPEALENIELELPEDVDIKWREIEKSLPKRGELDLPRLKDPAFEDAYVHLVTESHTREHVFITEKTWKPVASGQLFLVLGCPGTVAHLRSIGVDVFDDIIDHDYDLEKDPYLRIRKIHTSIRKLLAQDLYQINLLTKQRRTANAEKFYQGTYYQ